MAFSKLYFKELDSTQNEARRRLEALKELEAIWIQTRHQREGRGRQGRSWLDDPLGQKILLSLGYRLPKNLNLPLTWIPLLAGQCLFESLASFGDLSKNIFIKWPNDLMIEDGSRIKKIGGILSEVSSQKILTLGWGINLRSQIPLDEAFSLHESYADQTLPFSPEALSQRLIENFEVRFLAWIANPDQASTQLRQTLESGAMKKMWGRWGQDLKGQRRQAQGLGTDGSLRVRGENSGAEEYLNSGEFILER